MKKLFLLAFLFASQFFMAQVGINTTNPNAQLDIQSTSQAAPSNTDGILIPKMDVFPAVNPTAAQQGMLVYLTTATTFSGNPKPIGFYYWNDSPADWIAVKGTDGGTLDQAYDFGGAGLGRTITADTGAVTINGTDGLVSTGTSGSGVLAPSGAGTRMVWNPRKAAFRAGSASGTQWDDANIGTNSVAFGSNTIASSFQCTSFGNFAIASGSISTAFGNNTNASGFVSTAFGHSTTASGASSTSFGFANSALGSNSTVFGFFNTSASLGETVIGIGATAYTPTTNGDTKFIPANATDRLFVIGNAIDLNNSNFVDASERSDAMVVLKNGLTRLPSTTNAMIDAADGKAVVTKEWLQQNTSGTLDQAYDFGGAGLGRTITADTGAVTINGTDGLVSTGTTGSGALAPSGAGTRMVWNPRKSAFRVGSAFGTQWDDANIGSGSVAFGFGTRASGGNSTSFGFSTTASGENATAFGFATGASGENATAFGNITNATGNTATAFGAGTRASGLGSTAFGSGTIASGSRSTAFGDSNVSTSYSETVLGIGATNYTPTLNGDFRFQTANSVDRLFVIGNAIDLNNSNFVDASERSDAMVVLKNGLTRLPSTTNAMIDAADGKAVVTKEWLQQNTSGTLDQAYDFGGAGLGNTITADAGAVLINGTDGLVSTGTVGTGAAALSGAGTRLVWNPRKAAFRAGTVSGTQWDDVNIGANSVAFGFATKASGATSTSFGSLTLATGNNSTAFGEFSIASGSVSTAFGSNTLAIGISSSAFGINTISSGDQSIAFGRGNQANGGNSFCGGINNFASSFCETVLGIGATIYTPSLNGATQFRAANTSDRLLVVGNAMDANSNSNVEVGERSDALVILKNGNTGLGVSAPQERLQVAGKSLFTDGFSADNAALIYRNNTDYMFLGPQSGSSANGGAMALFGTTNVSGGNAGGIDLNVLNGQLRITSAGNVGIGTTPTRKFHVSNGSSGGTPNVNAGVVLESSTNVYQHFLTPNANESGLLFGSNFVSIHGGIIFDNSDQDITFRTGGNTSRVVITNAGDVGIGALVPGGQLELSLNEGRKPTSNTWTIPSDARLKNVNGAYEKGLAEILQLRPIRYNYKNTEKKTFDTKVLDKEAYGFLAQEVQPLFPEAVGTDPDGYLNFDLHPILIASINALKELNAKNNQLEKENQVLKESIQELNQKVTLILKEFENIKK